MVVFDIFFKITLSQMYLQEICSPLQGRWSLSELSAKEIKYFPFSGSQSDPLTSYSNLIGRKTHLIMTQWMVLKAIIRAHFGNLSERSFRPSLSFLLVSGLWIKFSKGYNDHLLLIIFCGDISFIFLSFIHFFFKSFDFSYPHILFLCWCPPASSSLLFHSVSLILHQPYSGYWNPCICLLLH